MIGNGFIRKKVETLTLGEKLKKVRGEGRISLNEASRMTRIQVKYLESIESGEYEKLPPDVYVKGFIRSYAGYLGLNEGYFLKLYEKEKGIRRNIRKVDVLEKKGDFLKIPSFSITPRLLIVAAVIILVGGGFFYVYREVGSFVSNPRLIILEPAENSAIDDKFVVVKGVAEREVELSINGQKAFVGVDGKFEEKIELQAGLNVVTVKAKSKFGKESTKTFSVNATYDNLLKTENTATSEGVNKEIAKNNKELTMEVYAVVDAVWLSVEADGALVYSGTLIKNEIKIFKAQDKISVTSGKGSSTYVKVDGREAKVLSETAGVVKNILFTKGS